MNSMELQNKIQMFKHLHSSQKRFIKHQGEIPITTLPRPNKDELMGVPTIDFLCECVEDCMNGLNISVKDFVPSDSWNSLFHQMLENNNLDNISPPWVFPKFYGVGKNCGHKLEVNLQEVVGNTMHLTMLESLNDIQDNETQSSINTSAIFILLVLFLNPLWDIGLQLQLIKK